MPDTVSVTVKYFAALKDFTKVASEELDVPATLKVKDFLAHLITVQPALSSDTGRALLRSCACAVDLEYVDLGQDEDVFAEGAEVALIPPVSGG